MRIRILDDWVFFWSREADNSHEESDGYEIDNDHLEDTEESDSGD